MIPCTEQLACDLANSIAEGNCKPRDAIKHALDNYGKQQRSIAMDDARAEYRNKFHESLLIWRDLESPCTTCNGSGVRSYPNTSTYTHRAGGQTITTDVCNKCWGTGDKIRKGVNLLEIGYLLDAATCLLKNAEIVHKSIPDMSADRDQAISVCMADFCRLYNTIENHKKKKQK